MFVSTGRLIFQSLEERNSEKGNPLKIVHLADTENYQQIEFFADKNFELKANAGQNVSVVLTAVKVGYYTNINIVACKAI